MVYDGLSTLVNLTRVNPGHILRLIYRHYRVVTLDREEFGLGVTFFTMVVPGLAGLGNIGS